MTRPVSLALDSVRTDGERLTASATIDRYAFNLTHGRGMTGRHLHLTIEVTATAERSSHTA